MYVSTYPLYICLLFKIIGTYNFVFFHKREVFYFCKEKEVDEQYINFFGCEAGWSPYIYLGIAIHLRKLKSSVWKTVEDRFEMKLTSWVGNLLSYGDSLVLINSVLTNFPMFMLFLLEIVLRETI
jgi:hypothetical protein